MNHLQRKLDTLYVFEVSIPASHRFRYWPYKHTCKYTKYIDFTDESKIAVDTDDTDDEDLPQISLQEMLDDLHIADDPMGEED